MIETKRLKIYAASYLDSQECKECFYFPICDGGCHRVRMNNLHSENKHSTCTYFKGHLEELLELYYEKKKANTTRRGQKEEVQEK